MECGERLPPAAVRWSAWLGRAVEDSLQSVAVGVEDESGIVVRAVFWAKCRRTVVRPPCARPPAHRSGARQGAGKQVVPGPAQKDQLNSETKGRRPGGRSQSTRCPDPRKRSRPRHRKDASRCGKYPPGTGKVREAPNDPSSATEAGEDRLNHGTDPTASLCSLERLVRPGGVMNVETNKPTNLRTGNPQCHTTERANRGYRNTGGATNGKLRRESQSEPTAVNRVASRLRPTDDRPGEADDRRGPANRTATGKQPAKV